VFDCFNTNYACFLKDIIILVILGYGASIFNTGSLLFIRNTIHHVDVCGLEGEGGGGVFKTDEVGQGWGVKKLLFSSDVSDENCKPS